MTNLKVKVSNFGPISEGEVVIKPLTIFLGRNNTGKSYLAMLTHTFLESIFEYSIARDLVRLPLRQSMVNRRFIDKEQRRISNWMRKNRKEKLLNKLPEFISENLEIKKKFNFQKILLKR